MSNSYRSLGLAALVFTLLSGLAVLPAQAKSMENLQQTAGKRTPPGFNFTRPPLSIRQNYYDYLPGGFNNLPLQVIPQSEGGGYFLTYHARTQPISNRRVFYSYLNGSGNLVSDNKLSSVDIPEGYSDVAVDPVSGKPMYVWHANADADPQLEVIFRVDAFLAGLAGLFSDVQTVIDNPVSITAPDGSTTTDNQFVWPSIAIGPSPSANQRRVYVLARNSTSHNASLGGNVYLAFADFSTGDLENGTPMSWSYTSIPELDAWNMDNAVSRRPSGSLVADAAGNIYYAGYHSSSVTETDLDIFKCGNFGEGTWSRITSSSILPSWNPPSGPDNPVGYFTNDGGTPYSDGELNWKISNSGHLNASLDANGRIHFPALWVLTTGEDVYFPALHFVKSVVYDPVLNEIEIEEIFPQKNPGDTYNSCYTPWDLEAPWGVVDEWAWDPEYGYYPVFTTEWPFPHWDQSAHDHAMMFHYNNLKITQANEQGLMAAVWQDSQGSMNDNNGSADILISISPNNGHTWLEPIVLNSVTTPQLAGRCPMWVYPADRMIYQGIGDGWKRAKLGLMFYDDNTWGANVLTPPYHPNSDGGEMMFMELSIAYQYVGYETVANPVFSPLGGTFDHPVSVALSTPTSGATIRYTLDGSIPGYASPVYTEPLYLDANTVVNAFATRDGYDPSSVVSAQFYFQVANPAIQPEAGVYTQPVDVSMSCPTPNAQIRYTLDGSEPDAGSALYSQPLSLALDSSHLVKARAFHNGWLPSASVSAEYLITGGLEAPIINPPSGTYYLPIQVSIATPFKNIQIRYTLDGSEPNETSSPLYNAPLSISQNTTLKAKAFRANWQSSPTTEAVYGFPAYSTGIRKIYPNPFAGSLNIEMGIKEAGQRYKLAVYNLKGERVFDFEDQEQGVFQYQWDGRDRNGKRLAAGLYLLRFSSGTKVQTSKIMLMGAGRN